MCECKCGDQVPGRTITESMLAEVLADENWTFTPTHYFRVFSRLGITVVPDPEPTNADQIIDLMGMAPANLNRRELAKWLDSRGVKAPGGDDE